jgi:hypothetical protein
MYVPLCMYIPLFSYLLVFYIFCSVFLDSITGSECCSKFLASLKILFINLSSLALYVQFFFFFGAFIHILIMYI